ncbi:Flp family type IVb pilin [Arthrobacter sp. W4I7]|uniref:Flp family type IVb pilin n=1 Tax=Arthrobacter sp. W4I7 TaxID=3042296 RepID=UPI002780DBBB|nr:Flp family type IVb pilin [Arthrobacter sp. W4I7]MDQ0690158.1 pilus assembly protein Flp/PilA [Arthrobacter sp. W4I7]
MSTLLISIIAGIAGLRDRLQPEKGATATEYSLLVAFIAFIIIVGVTAFGNALSAWFTSLGTTVSGW